MSERTRRDYAQAVERVVLSSVRHAPHAGAEARALVRALVSALKREAREPQYGTRTRIGLTIAYRVLSQVSARLDRETLYK